MSARESSHRLYYWPGIQGRGEFVRLVLEDAAVPYVDVARLPEAEGGGVRAIVERLARSDAAPPPAFAPPLLEHGELLLAQTTTICRYLAELHGRAPRTREDRLRADFLALTIADFVGEIHDTHHPIAGSLYFEDQKTEAVRRSRVFLGERLPKFFAYFERVLVQNAAADGAWMLGGGCTYVDLLLFQVLVGLEYAFPRRSRELLGRHPHLQALRVRVEQRPRLAAYLASERRIPFNEHGIFRFYPELESA